MKNIIREVDVMNISRKILCIALMLCLIGAYAYGYSQEPLSEDILKNNLEEDFGINIVLPSSDEYISYIECLQVLERGLSRFPDGVIKEITQYYSDMGIKTNIIVSKTEKISDLFSKYSLSENSANIYINTLQNSLYNDICVASEVGFVYELGHFIGDYLFKVYGYEEISKEFEKLNVGYNYGAWEDGFDKAFVNKHSALSLNEEIVDLIWYAEVHPEFLRNINDGQYTVIHNKIQYLASVIDQSFSSITSDLRLWHEAIPQKPDTWAKDVIQSMRDAALIPEEFDGIYNSNITKEDFYTLTFNIIENKIGEENFVKSFQLVKEEDHVTIDPVKGEVFVKNCSDVNNTDINDEKAKRLYEAYQIGLIDKELSGAKEYMTRLEIAKLFGYIVNRLGMDISDYEVLNYDDISSVKESEKPFIYYVSSHGLLMGNGSNFNPNSYCTYQEAYLILMRFYNML